MNDKWLPYILILPSLFFLVLLFIVPFAQVFGLAFTESGSGEMSFENFAILLDDFNFSSALQNTLLLAAVIVPLQLIFALCMAFTVAKVTKNRDIILYIFSIPLGISDLAAGIVWLAIFEQSGYLNSLLSLFGVDNPTLWLSSSSPVAIFVAVVLAEIWRATAIVMIILVAGLGLIPKEFSEASQIFGASKWQQLWKVTLPMLRPSLQTALILRTMLAFEVFGVVMVLGGVNMPVLMGETFAWQFSYREPGVASAYAIILLAISIVCTLFFMKALDVPKEAKI